jgi:hypothetical protein
MMVIGYMMSLQKRLKYGVLRGDSDILTKEESQCLDIPFNSDTTLKESPFYRVAMKKLQREFGVTYATNYVLGKGMWLACDETINETDEVSLAKRESSKIERYWNTLTSIALKSEKCLFYDPLWFLEPPLRRVPAVRYESESPTIVESREECDEMIGYRDAYAEMW